MKISKLKDIEIFKHSLKFLLISKNVISLFNILGGFYYIADLLNITLNNFIISLVISGIILLFVEVILVYTMLYSFNLFFRSKYWHGIVFSIIFFVFYAGSFYATVNGLGYWLKDQEKITKNIDIDYKAMQSVLVDSLYKEHLKYKTIADSLLSIPQAKYYSERQMEKTRIDIVSNNSEKYFQLYLSEKDKSYQDYKINMVTAKNQIKDYSKKYYFFGFAIMILLIFFNLMYAYYDFYVENRGQIKEVVKMEVKPVEKLSNDNIKKLWHSGKFGTKKELSIYLNTNQAKITRATK